MTLSDPVVLREGPPRALVELRDLLRAGGIEARVTKAEGCSPGG